jgi:DNA-binding transcriptional LysR family regulator
MRLTPDGAVLLVEARALLAAHDEILAGFGATDTRTVVVGATEHGAEQLLPHVRAALARDLPDAQVRFRLDRGTNLNDGLDRGTIDAAILLGAAHESSEQVGELPLAWYSASGWAVPSPVPLVAIDSPCTIRRKAVATLDAAGVAHIVVAEAGYLAGVLNAVRAGVGVALLAHRGPAPEGLEIRGDLPGAQPEPLHVRSRSSASPSLTRSLTAAVHAALGE